MEPTFHTIIHAAPKIEVDELSEVRMQLGRVLGKEFVHESDTDYSCINKVVRIVEKGRCLFVKTLTIIIILFGL